MNTVERIKSICRERKIPISQLERECGFSNGYIGQLRKGSIPGDRLKIISDYFDLSIDYLLGSENYEYDKNDSVWDYHVSKHNQMLIEKVMLDPDLSKRLISYAEKLASILDEEEIERKKKQK